MAKLSNTVTKVPAKRGPIRAKTATPTTKTHEGARAYKLDAKSELFTLAVTNMVGEDTFYESAKVRDKRFRELIHEVTDADPRWMQLFIPYLRTGMFMRTASIVAAAEYTLAGGPNARNVINSALQRADEPAEFLAYWMQRNYGWDQLSYPMPAPKLPQAVRKGLSDACVRLYNQYSVMKYNGLSRGVAMGNVLNLVHPDISASRKYISNLEGRGSIEISDEEREAVEISYEKSLEIQNSLFKYIVDRHHNNKLDLGKLSQICEYNLLNQMPDKERNKLLTPALIKKAGMTWESLSAWGKMDAAKWELVIPNMGYMALLRNLRNFEQAGIGKATMREVADRIADPEQVRRSKQFPFRFLSAFEQVNNVIWMPALEAALDTSVENIPEFKGSSEILIDVSGSMDAAVSQHSTMQRWKIGALFATALSYKCKNADVIVYGTSSKQVFLPLGGSVLTGIGKVYEEVRRNTVGHGTNTWSAMKQNFDSHNRVVIFTDAQSTDSATGIDIAPIIHEFTLGGYGRSALDLGKKGRYGYGGFSDKTFALMKLLEDTRGGSWPFIDN